MNHAFVQSQLNNGKCARCHFSEIDHTSRATCEACGNSGTCDILYGNMLLCMDCIDKEKKAQAENMKPENQAKRLIEHAKAVDAQVNVKQDLYNAETVSHVDAFKAIDSDPTVENKMFAKASFLKDRFNHFQQIIFDARSALENASNAQRAINDSLNGIANKLRDDEREKLKIHDNSYKVQAPKSIKPKSSKPSEKKYTKQDVRFAAATYKVPMEMVTMMCVSRNIMPEEAAKILAVQIHGVN